MLSPLLVSLKNYYKKWLLLLFPLWLLLALKNLQHIAYDLQHIAF